METKVLASYIDHAVLDPAMTIEELKSHIMILNPVSQGPYP